MKYVVTGTAGSYSDATWWPIAGYDSLEEATLHVKMAEKAHSLYCERLKAEVIPLVQKGREIRMKNGNMRTFNNETKLLEYSGPDADVLSALEVEIDDLRERIKEETGFKLCQTTYQDYQDNVGFQVETIEDSSTFAPIIQRMLAQAVSKEGSPVVVPGFTKAE